VPEEVDAIRGSVVLDGWRSRSGAEAVRTMIAGDECLVGGT
jgi:hypothetical protein